MAGRAVVLGSGGVIGIAWETGVLAALAADGLDLREADLIVGTSAGAVVGAQLATGLHPEDLYARQLRPPVGEQAPKASPFAPFRIAWQLTRSKTIEEYGARMGRIALAARTPSEQERRAEVARWLGDEVREWPDRRLVITAVDAETGKAADFDAAGGVDLVDAVCASTAGPGTRPPATIGGRRYIDGGTRSPANVDLAAGYERIVVIAPFTRGGGVIPGVERQIAELGDQAKVALITPDAASWREARGRSLSGLLDPARRAPAARNGRSVRAAERVAAVWNA
ncbi:patatin-like phospholipase family protein [Nonomuraea jiangxiensis]|uniref:NTE family protein n=1 Tax=Nonomuraea jiangxiensis TaxID=633440 RepID=A0A1G9V8K3_9ACTN|nr:patatin-like phospholipase family protein [Nonomuraea jiangxiensis]SDM68538.1 NTE family protein [Nonomuraea jiangxiensis]